MTDGHAILDGMRTFIIVLIAYVITGVRLA
jgi:hypothetical protein